MHSYKFERSVSNARLIIIGSLKAFAIEWQAKCFMKGHDDEGGWRGGGPRPAPYPFWDSAVEELVFTVPGLKRRPQQGLHIARLLKGQSP